MLKSVNDMYFKEEIEVQINEIKNGSVEFTKEELENFIDEIRVEKNCLTGVDKKEMIEELSAILKRY